MRMRMGLAINGGQGGPSAAASFSMTFLHQDMDTDFTTTRTYNNGVDANIPADLDGERIVVVVSTREHGTSVVSSVTIGGTAATLRLSETTWQRAYVYDAVGGTTNDDIVVTLVGGEAAFISIYSTTGTYQGGVTANNSGGTVSPYTADLSQNTTAAQAVVGALGGSGITGASYTGLTQRGSITTVGGRNHVHFDDLSVSGGTPETFEAIMTGGGTIFSQACLARYG